MQKMDTIAATMKAFMESGPSVTEFPTYRALNDHVGKIHGKEEGKVQALAGPKAWAWTPDPAAGTWRKSTDAEFKTKQEAAASRNHGRKAKVLSDEDRASLDAQIIALQAVNNPALAPLLAELKSRQTADDTARKGSLKDRLAAAVEKLGLENVVEILEAASEAPEE